MSVSLHKTAAIALRLATDVAWHIYIQLHSSSESIYALVSNVLNVRVREHFIIYCVVNILSSTVYTRGGQTCPMKVICRKPKIPAGQKISLVSIQIQVQRMW